MSAPTRDLPKIGLRFSVQNPSQWSRDIFVGICIANGCDYATAQRHARQLGEWGELSVTIRPLKDRESFVAACKMVGVRIEDIPALVAR
ncbi:hypothetical protein EHM76_00320 [bacterium]|nr:MAG: hypothetical protein EHM76_00320 [bacterium]